MSGGFRLPRGDGDPHSLAGVLGTGHACVAVERGNYFQTAYIIPKGSDAALRAQGIESLHRGAVELVPLLADRIGGLTSFDGVKLLDVQVNRLRRWYTDGLLFIGDVAHAMSPVGGVGINLSMADAAANRPGEIRLINRTPALQTLLAGAVAIGSFAQHTPGFARR